MRKHHEILLLTFLSCQHAFEVYRFVDLLNLNDSFNDCLTKKSRDDNFVNIKRLMFNN